MTRSVAAAGVGLIVFILSPTGAAAPAPDLPDVFSEDVARFRAELASPLWEVRLGGVQGLAYLAHHSFEPDLLRALRDADARVRREAALGLARLGRRDSVAPLIKRLRDREHEVRRQAAVALERITGHTPPVDRRDDRDYWRQWWGRVSPAAREEELIGKLADETTRDAALRALVRLGGSRTEDALLALAQAGRVSRSQVATVLEALEPVATVKSLPLLEKLPVPSSAVPWALGNIGEPRAEKALLAGLRAWRTDALINLDRLHSRAAFAAAPELVRAFGLVSYRTQPDDLHLDPTPVQRLAARLLIRTGRAPEIVDLILAKLDGQQVTVARKDDPTIRALQKIVDAMEPELRPGFHRADGYAQSIPLCAMSHLVRDPALAGRLIALLDHPAYVVRVYAATALGRLGSAEAVPAIVKVLRGPYPFPDAATQVSGKHGPQTSRIVRWKGYLAIALGRIGSDEARATLEQLVVDPSAPRDVRFGAAVGLGFIASEASRAALVRASASDVVRWIRETAARSLAEIDLRRRANGRSGDGGEARPTGSPAGAIAAPVETPASPPAREPAPAEASRSRRATEIGDGSAAELLARLGETPSFALALAFVEGADAGSVTRALQRHRHRAIVAWALGRRPVPAARETLESLVGSADQVLAYHAAFALGAIGDERSVPVLARQMPENPSDYWELARWTRQGYRGLFHRIRRGETRMILAEPHQRNLRVVYAATEALGRIGGADAEAALRRALGSEQYLVRYGAVCGLGAIGESAQAVLERVARSDPVLVVRAAAERALAALTGEPAHTTAPGLDRLDDVPAIAFIRTAHRSDANFGFRDSYFFPKTPWYASGENIYTLTPPRPDGELRNITRLSGGAVQGLETAPDGQRLLFAMRPDAKADSFHVYEIDTGGSNLRQITRGECNDVDPVYLPDGRIAFSSDRDGTHEFYHQERVRTIYVCRADGSDVRQLTFNPNQDYEPLALADGRILYSSYRFYGQDGSGGVYRRGGTGITRIETQLRTVLPDGTNDRHLYGAQRGSFYVPVRELPDGDQFQAPQLVWSRDHLGTSISHAREMPDGRLVCTSPAGLTIVDPAAPPLDCEVPVFPEVVNLAGGEEVYIHNHDDLNPVGRYTSPYPVDDHTVLVSFAPFFDRAPNAYGLYLFDLRSRKRTLVYDEPGYSEVDVVPVAPTRTTHLVRGSSVPRAAGASPPATAHANGEPATGEIFVHSVFHSDLEFDREEIRYLRVATAEQLGVTINANGGFRSRVIGTFPIEADGSIRVRVPARTPLHLLLLDVDENPVIHETSFNSVAPGEVVACIGCHERRGTAPPRAARVSDALRHPPHRAGPFRNDLIYMGQPDRSYSVLKRK